MEKIKTPNLFTIDFEKEINFNDVLEILKAMDLHISWNGYIIPEKFKYLSEKGLLKTKC